MGCSVSMSAEEKEAAAESRKISRDLARSGAVDQSVTKLLLLGSGDSGKSTILKQVKILHSDGFSREELLGALPVVRQNALDSMRALLESVEEEGDFFKMPENLDERNSKVVLEAGEDGLQDVERRQELSLAMSTLWRDQAVRDCYEFRRHLLQVQDSAAYFFDAAERIFAPNYVPTKEDFLKLRVRTTGVVEASFRLKHKGMSLAFRMIDVGGQRSERRKWIHCFENVDAILFVVAISEYNQVLVEDGLTNRMDESLKLFESIVNNAFFVRTSFILFLNKVDLFDKKLSVFPLEKYQPSFKDSNSFPREFIASMYLGKVRRAAEDKKKKKGEESSSNNKTLFHHFTCATDTGQIKVIFQDVIEIIIQRTLRESHLL